jgi:hypothetical protein
MRLRKFWVSPLAGVGVVLISYAAMFAYDIEFPQMGEARQLALFLFSVVTLILGGAIGSFLAWRMGFGRGGRLAAGLGPVMVILCLVVYMMFIRSSGTSQEPVYKLIDGLIGSVWKPTLYVMIGAAPFLFPKEHAQ